MENKKDRRRYKRYAFSGEVVIFRPTGYKINGKIRDISLGGMGVTCPEIIAEKSTLSVLARLGEEECQRAYFATKIQHVAVNGLLSNVGLQFQFLVPKTIRCLHSAIEDLETLKPGYHV